MLYALYHGYPPEEHDDLLTLDFVSGDTLPEYPFYLRDENNQPVDMTGFTVEMHIAYNTPLTVSGAYSDQTQGEFYIDFGPGDLVQGVYEAEIQITNAAGKIQTWRNIRLNIYPEIA